VNHWDSHLCYGHHQDPEAVLQVSVVVPAAEAAEEQQVAAVVQAGAVVASEL
jgi:hypothetical protein